MNAKLDLKPQPVTLSAVSFNLDAMERVTDSASAKSPPSKGIATESEDIKQSEA